MRFNILVAASALALSAGFGSVAYAQTYTDTEAGFSIEFPDSWKVEKQTAGDLKVSATTRNKKLQGVSCSVAVSANPQSTKLPQSEIDKDLEKPLGEDWWKQNVFSSMKDVTFEATGAGPHPSGRTAQTAIGGGNFAYEKYTMDLKQTVVIMMTPGKTFQVTCVALKEDFNKLKSDFEATIASFRPQ